ncbi:hypothetical protein ABBQ38_001611 [Trebouxia sp. C0009 RCD-2024]
MSDENASYVGNQAEPRKSYHDAITEPANVKEKGSQSHSSDGGSVDDQFDDASSGDEIDDENAESDLKPYIFSSDGARRSFVVQQITRANSSHRPSFTFVGYVVEYTGGSGNKTERGSSAGSMSSRHHREDSQTARGGLSQRSRIIVIASDLSLNITYEPPSPKFHQQCPGSSSYRLKLFKGSDFLYSVRGLPHQVKVHQNAYVVSLDGLLLLFKALHAWLLRTQHLRRSLNQGAALARHCQLLTARRSICLRRQANQVLSGKSNQPVCLRMSVPVKTTLKVGSLSGKTTGYGLV